MAAKSRFTAIEISRSWPSLLLQLKEIDALLIGKVDLYFSGSGFVQFKGSLDQLSAQKIHNAQLDRSRRPGTHLNDQAVGCCCMDAEITDRRKDVRCGQALFVYIEFEIDGQVIAVVTQRIDHNTWCRAICRNVGDALVEMAAVVAKNFIAPGGVVHFAARIVEHRIADQNHVEAVVQSATGKQPLFVLPLLRVLCVCTAA